MRTSRSSAGRRAGSVAAVAALALWLCQAGPAAAQQWAGTGSNINNTNAGNVGVGTGTPGAKLDVGAGSAARGGYTDLLVGARGDNSQLEFFGPTKSAAIQYDEGTGGLLFYTNAPVWTQALFLGNSGRVGVGTTAPSSSLHVHSATGAQAVRVSGAGGAYLNFLDTAAAANQRLFQWRSEGGVARLALLNDAENAFARQNILVASAAGNVGVGTASPQKALDVAGDIRASGDLIVGGNVSARFQDVAEWVPSTQKLAAGTVVTLDPQRANHVLASTGAYDTSVAGVVSEQPGLILGEGGEGKVKVATTGRVKVKVDATKAPIKIGDLLVTSGVPGVAMKSEAVSLSGVMIHRPGTIIGKALEPLGKGTGEILVLLSMQ